MVTTNSIITYSLLIGLFLITLSFVLYKRKALLMLRALFSKRYLQQLLREGKLLNEQIYLYTLILYFFTLPGLILVVLELSNIEIIVKIANPLLLYLFTAFGLMVLFAVLRLFLWYFTTFFNYKEQNLLYLSVKLLYRFYNVLILFTLIPIAWYTRTVEVIYFVYFPLFIIIFLAFFIHFMRNIYGITRIHFFIYFCTLEILPYLLLLKLLIIKL